jgi:epoxyqueuosine reductase QueG
MNDEIKKSLFERGVDVIRFVDISCFPKEQTLGFEKAIIFCMVLSKKYIIDIRYGKEIDYDNDEYLTKELKVEKLADWLADYIRQKGFKALSQSEESNLKNGYVEQAYIEPELKQGISFLPLKAIARLAGLGFIGKSNLLVTEEYGSAFTMCAVLTNAPIAIENFPIVESKCGSCEACVINCPANALSGNEWTISGGRESLVDVSKCCCALKCMVFCPWTLKYASVNI